MNLSDYLAIQIALKKVEGLHIRVFKYDDDHKDGVQYISGDNDDLFEEIPYKLEFDDKERVTDKCMNEIFNTPFEDRLAYTAKHLPSGIPEKIIHPFTKQAIEGIEIIQPLGGMPKKS